MTANYVHKNLNAESTRKKSQASRGKKIKQNWQCTKNQESEWHQTKR